MSEIRLIDANALKEVIETYRPVKCFTDKDTGKNRMVDYCLSEIDNAPTVEYPFYQGTFQSGYVEGENEIAKSIPYDVSEVTDYSAYSVSVPENLIKPIAEIKCEISEEEKQRIIELLRKEKPKIVKLEPEITEEQAIDKLRETGWIIKHDKEMTERLQGECKDCKYFFDTVGRCDNCNRNHWYSDNFIMRGEE